MRGGSGKQLFPIAFCFGDEKPANCNSSRTVVVLVESFDLSYKIGGMATGNISARNLLVFLKLQ